VDDRTAVRPEVLPVPKRRRLPPPLRWLIPAGAATALLLVLFIPRSGPARDPAPIPELNAFSTRNPLDLFSLAAEPADSSPLRPKTGPTVPPVVPDPVSLIPPDPARVRFAAYPWAQVRVDDLAPFHTPRAERLTLEPGTHEVVFSHPVFGQEVREIELRAGEELLVSHVFGQVSKR
jgi:hypothetical protein